MYAVIETGGKQLRVVPGQEIKVEKLSGEVGEKVFFGRVLLASDEGGLRVGQPVVDDTKVRGLILRHGKDRKVLVVKYKRRKNYRRKRGHRQPFTLVRIESIQPAA